MVTFEKVDNKKYEMRYNGHTIETLDLITSSVTNKFEIITTFIEGMSKKLGKEFDAWFLSFFNNYVKDEKERFNILLSSLEKVKAFVNKYITLLDIDFTKFIDETKVKKTTILFSSKEIEKIAKTSSLLKFYSIILCSQYKLPVKIHKKFYNILVNDLFEYGIVSKIYEVIKTKSFRYSLTDKPMWDYIKRVRCKTLDVHIVEIFNFIMNNILVLCEPDKNPITFFSTVVDENTKWVLRGVYKDVIVYDTEMTSSRVHEFVDSNNLRFYCFNDTIGRLKASAFQKICDEFDDPMLTRFQDVISSIEYMSPLVECVVYPVFSQVLKIPYSHFLSLQPNHAAILSAYLGIVMEKSLKDYKTISKLLMYYPKKPTPVSTTYKIKSMSEFVNLQNKVNNFYGFKTKILANDVLSYFVGRLSRNSFYYIVDGSELLAKPVKKVEEELVKFLTLLFSGKLTKELEIIKGEIEKDF